MARFQDMGDCDYARATSYVCNLNGAVRLDGELARRATREQPVYLPERCGCCGLRSLLVKRTRPLGDDKDRGYDELALRCQTSGSERTLRATIPLDMDDT